MFTEQSYNFDNTLEDFVEVNYRNCVVLVETHWMGDTNLLFTINFPDSQYQVTDQVSQVDKLIDAWEIAVWGEFQNVPSN